MAAHLRTLVVLLVVSFLFLQTTNARPSTTFFGSITKFLFNLPDDVYESQTGGGIDCAGCTLGVGLVEQLSQVYNSSVDATMEMLCSFLPVILQEPCQELITEFGPTIIELLEKGFTADAVCSELELCTNSTCSLYPAASSKTWVLPLKLEIRTPSKPAAKESSPKIKQPTWSPWTWLVEEVNHVFQTHEPLVDFDDDNFSTYFGLRGSYWRGKDCDDGNSDIYPGRRPTNANPDVDHNCNGIYGTAANGTSWEELYCSGTQQFGIALLGDSAGAHFHIPPSYITATEINGTTYQSAVEIIQMEGDWPQMSAATGFMSSAWTGAPEGPVASSYLNNVQQNRCAHRDFQSIAVNGARSHSITDIMKSYSRNQTLDLPSVTSIALLGNDVCNGHPGTESMTTPQEFYTNIMQVLEYLDTVLPAGSHVTMMGLIDGRILYDTMAQRIHPIGSLRRDVTYAKFYDFLNCLQISPCWGWMNSDADARNATTARAFELNDVYKAIIANSTFKHFDMTYTDCPMKEVVDIWTNMGGQAYELIEPVDGFHPTQISNALFTKYQWDLYAKKYPYLVPPVNPYNELIKQRFGDQGGY